MLLSVLICTLVRREDRFLHLLGTLLPQAEAFPGRVEVVALQNGGEKSLAEYREALLRDARGKYLCYVDDDDAVADCYIAELVSALDQDPDVVAFDQFCTGIGASLTRFGLEHEGAPWHPVMSDGQLAYLRAYSHVQPIRSEIARQGSFIRSCAPGYTGEDVNFAQSVLPLLRERGSRQARIGQVLYSYLWRSAGDSTQDGPQPAGLAIQAQSHMRPVINSFCFRWCTL